MKKSLEVAGIKPWTSESRANRPNHRRHRTNLIKISLLQKAAFLKASFSASALKFDHVCYTFPSLLAARFHKPMCSTN